MSVARLVAWYSGLVVFALPWVALVFGLSDVGFMMWLFHVMALIMAILWVTDVDKEDE